MKKVLLMILDGWGKGKEYRGNAIKLASTPNIDYLINNYPNTELEASGLSVGLPDGQMGNSEVGHLNIGAGRVIYQDFTKITKDIEKGNFFDNEALNKAIDHAINNNSNLHLLGLLSHGGVHSHINHIFALLELCNKRNFKNVYIHAFLDGRDVSPHSGEKDIKLLLDKMKELKVGKLASISGRYYSMDRDNRWDRIEKSYNVMVNKTDNITDDPIKYIENSYKEDITDEFIEPVSIKDDNKIYNIKDNDSIIFFNFRPDRARQMTRAIIDEDFNGFSRNKLNNIKYICMTEYDKTIENIEIAYPSENYKNTLGEVISDKSLKQLRIAETEKYAHVTFFFNGGVEEPNIGEERILINSPKVATYDLQPEMSALKIKEEVIEKIKDSKYGLIILNFANTDMVGHTGNIEAAIKAVETVDKCVGEIIEEIDKKDMVCLITADHGNSEYLINEENDEIFTAHTTNKVPFIVYTDDNIKLNSGKLSDIAPTILDILDIEKPVEMTGNSLIN